MLQFSSYPGDKFNDESHKLSFVTSFYEYKGAPIFSRVRLVQFFRTGTRYERQTKNMRRKDREMDQAFALDVIDRCAYAVMSMVSPDGSPYGVPLSIVRIDEYIYFHCAPEGKKLEALRKNPKVSVSCVGNVKPLTDEFTTEFESAIVLGTAERVEAISEKIEALRAICLRYTPTHMDAFDSEVARSLHRTEVWKIHIDEVSSKRKKMKTEDQG